MEKLQVIGAGAPMHSTENGQEPHYNARAALLERQNATLVGVSRPLTDPQYREWVVR